MKKCWFHEWEQLQEEHTEVFYGEKCDRLIGNKYSICRKCHQMRKFTFTLRGGFYTSVNECRANILKKYINFETFVIDLPEATDEAPPVPPGRTGP